MYDLPYILEPLNLRDVRFDVQAGAYRNSITIPLHMLAIRSFIYNCMAMATALYRFDSSIQINMRP